MCEEYYHKVSVDTLDDLACRFLLNIPESDRTDLIRKQIKISFVHVLMIFIQDLFRHRAGVLVLPEVHCWGGARWARRPRSLRSDCQGVCSTSIQVGDKSQVKLKSLSRHVPYLRGHTSNVSEILESWLEYNMSVPTFGAIILNQTCSKVLLVQSKWTILKIDLNTDRRC